MSGAIKINSLTPDTYPYGGLYYGGIATSLQAIAAPDWEFDYWETVHASPTPTVNDSMVTVNFTGTDTVIAHFKPPITLPVVLLTDPPGSASIKYNTTLYSEFPATVLRFPEVTDTLTVIPNLYYTFKYWEFKYNTPNQNDTTMLKIPVTIFYPDTIIAHMEEQEYVWYSPNAFTPDGDQINDTWKPINNVVELETYQLQIFDRWGRELMQSTDPFEEWDGKVGGSPVPMGVYVYRVKLREAFTKEEHEINGFVTVIR